MLASIVAVIVAVVIAVSPQLYMPTRWICPRLDSIRGSVVVLTGASQGEGMLRDVTPQRRVFLSQNNTGGLFAGIGEEVAVQYGALGARLVLASRRRTQLEVVAKKARAAGAQDVIVVPADMTSPDDCDAVIAAAAESHGKIDVLMLNHATSDDKLFVGACAQRYRQLLCDPQDACRVRKCQPPVRWFIVDCSCQLHRIGYAR